MAADEVTPIKPTTLLAVGALALTGFTGLVLILPPKLAARFWRRIAETSEEVIGAAVLAWADDEIDRGDVTA